MNGNHCSHEQNYEWLNRTFLNHLKISLVKISATIKLFIFHSKNKQWYDMVYCYSCYVAWVASVFVVIDLIIIRKTDYRVTDTLPLAFCCNFVHSSPCSTKILIAASNRVLFLKWFLLIYLWTYIFEIQECWFSRIDFWRLTSQSYTKPASSTAVLTSSVNKWIAWLT